MIRSSEIFFVFLGSDPIVTFLNAKETQCIRDGGMRGQI